MRLMDCNETLRKVEQIPFIENENKAFHEGCRYMQKKVLRILHESKSVDAEPIRHGHWITYKDNEHEYYCSECEFPAGLNAYGYHCMQDPYCRFCGARMDEAET